MSIIRLEVGDYQETVTLWNNNVQNKEVLYKKMNQETFIQKFIAEETPELKKINYIAKEDGKVVGFANGCYKEGETTGYMTFVLVDEVNHRKGIGTALFNQVEQEIIEKGNLVKIDILFFNPINLEWVVPYTNGHDHPNAPGADVGSEAYIFIKKKGYKAVVAQNVFYQLLAGFEYRDFIQ